MIDPRRPWLPGLALGLALLAVALGPDRRGVTGDETPPGDAAGSSPRDPGLPGGAPEIATYRNVVFLLDASGSMAVARRFERALAILDDLLAAMSETALFDIYLVTDRAHSLLGHEYYRPLPDMRRSIRGRVEQAGGLAYGGYTDLTGAIRVAAEKRRPDAIYVLTDGVQTLGDLDTQAIHEAAVRSAKAGKARVHTIGIALGADPAEDGLEAAELLRAIANATGGIAREAPGAGAPLPGSGRAFRRWPADREAPPDERARIRFFSPAGAEIHSRSFPVVDEGADFLVAVDDPGFTHGPVIFEYTDVKLVARSYFDGGGIVFDEVRIPLRPDGQRLAGAHPVRLVPAGHDGPDDRLTSTGAVKLRCSEGPVELVYSRGGRLFREAAELGGGGATRRPKK